MSRLILVCAVYVCLITPTIANAEDTQSKSLIFYEIHYDGDVTKLNSDIDTIQKSTNKISVLLDYRSLGDPNILNKIKQTPFFASGIIIDIDEDLRRDAGVTYTSSWPSSISSVEQTTILGYNKSNRRKLIDTLVHAFERSLGVLPTIASSKIIDTNSANYLKDTYGTQIQIIDEEYKDLNHSTLDGGPGMIAYPASVNWLLVPDYKRDDPVWVIRRTPSDLDYSLLKGDFESKIFFFSNRRSLTSSSRYELGNTINAHTSIDPIKSTMSNTKNSSLFYYGNNDAGIYEVVTPHYRMRLLKKRGDMWITDIRLYDEKITDPYNSRIANYGFYEIVPYLLNDTGWHDERMYFISTPEMVSRMELPTIRLGSSPFFFSTGAYGYGLSYKSEGIQPTIIFNLDSIQMVGLGRTSQKLPFINKIHPLAPIESTRESLEWKNNQTIMFGVDIDCQSAECILNFKSPHITELQFDSKQNKQFLFPEPELYTNLESIKLTSTSTYLQVGRAEHIYLTHTKPLAEYPLPPKDSHLTLNSITTDTPWSKPSRFFPAEYILTPEQSGSIKVGIKSAGSQNKERFEVVLDCKADWMACVRKPLSLLRYFMQ